MRKLILVGIIALLTSCGGYIDALNAYRNTPAGQEQLRREFVIDSIRASRTIYPFRYDYNYYWNNRIYPNYYRHYAPPRRVIRRVAPARTRVRVAPRSNSRPATRLPRRVPSQRNRGSH